MPLSRAVLTLEWFVAAGGKYVPPAARARAAVGGSREDERVVRRVRGLLNRLAEANLQGIVGDLVELYNSSARRLVRDTAFECILQVSRLLLLPEFLSAFLYAAGVDAAPVGGCASRVPLP